MATNDRSLALQADLLASPVDTGQLAALATPTLVGQRRVSGLKLHDERVIRLLETLLHPGAFARDWTTRDVHARVLAQHGLAETDYRLSQLRYDLAKLRAKGLVAVSDEIFVPKHHAGLIAASSCAALPQAARACINGSRHLFGKFVR